MAVFIVTYDTHAGRNYAALYKGMKENGGIALAESVWGIQLNNTAAEIRDWVKSLLDNDDTIVVIQVKPTPSWATSHAKKPATDWLKANCQSS